jgi:serine/threonine protein kinase
VSSIKVNRVALGPLRGLLVASCDTPGWREALAEPDRLLGVPGAKILKDSPTTLAAIVPTQIDGRKHSLHLKRLNRRGMEFTVKYLFQRSRAVRLFRRLIDLIERDVPTLQPVAALAERTGPFLQRSYLVTEHLDAVPFFQLWEKDIYPSGNDPARRRKIMSDVAHLAARMHKAGVYHRDLKSSNILIKADGEPVIADLDGARVGASVGYRQRVRDLARLSTSLVPLANAADRHVFLREYIRVLGAGDDLKKMGRDIAHKGLSILRYKRAKNKYDEHEYRYVDEFARRQRRWLRT